MKLFLSIHSLKNFSQAWLKRSCLFENVFHFSFSIPGPHKGTEFSKVCTIFFRIWKDRDIRVEWLRSGLVAGNLSLYLHRQAFEIVATHTILSPIQSICPCHDDRVLASCHGKKAILWVVISRQAKHVRAMLLLPFTNMQCIHVSVLMVSVHRKSLLGVLEMEMYHQYRLQPSSN